MDREEAHKLLGLYVGAKPEHIKSKYDSMSADLHTQLAAEGSQTGRSNTQTQLDQLTLARDTALAGDASETSAPPPHPPVVPAYKRGKFVVLFMAVTMVMIASTSLIGIWYLDKQRDTREAESRHEQAVHVREAWHRYLDSRGVDQTADGQLAEDAFAAAERTLQAGHTSTAKEDFKTVLELYIAAAQSENASLADDWKHEVVDVWKQRLKPRFPFDKSSETDASMADVEALFAPKSGVVWQTAAAYDALQDVVVFDRYYVTLPNKFRESVASAEAIRDALFPNGSAHVDVSFAIRLAGVKALAVVELQTCSVTVGSRDDNFAAAHWTPETAGAHLGTRKVGDRPGKQPDLDVSTSEWGLLRILSYGEYHGANSEGIHTWDFEIEGDGPRQRTLQGEIQMKLRGDSNIPFTFTTYSAFQPA